MWKRAGSLLNCMASCGPTEASYLRPRRSRLTVAHPTAGTVIDHLDRRGAALHTAPSLHPFPAARTNPGHERVGQALRFRLSDLVKMKAVPARTCMRLGLDLGEQTLNAKGAGLHGCWSSRAQRLSDYASLAEKHAETRPREPPPRVFHVTGTLKDPKDAATVLSGSRQDEVMERTWPALGSMPRRLLARSRSCRAGIRARPEMTKSTPRKPSPKAAP
jgi:hypothetical protein